jgi:hypothetical protein
VGVAPRRPLWSTPGFWSLHCKSKAPSHPIDVQTNLWSAAGTGRVRRSHRAGPRSELVLSDVPEQGLAGQPRAEPRVRSSRPAARPGSRADGRTTQHRRMGRTARCPRHTARSGPDLQARLADPAAVWQPSKAVRGGTDAGGGVTSLVAHELRGHEETRFRLGYYTSSEVGFRS